MKTKCSKHILNLSILVLVLFFTACQPTPEKPAVAEKNDGQMEQKISATAAPGNKYTAPDKWKEIINNDSGEPFIEIDAPITLPQVDKYPVVSVKPGKYTQELVNKMVGYFSQGKPLIAVNETLTKKAIEERIIDLKATLEQAKNGKEDIGTPEEIQQQIDQLNEAYKNAPETVAQETVDATMKYDPELKQEVLDVRVDMGKSKKALISAINCSDENYESDFCFYNFEEDSLYRPLSALYGKNAEGCKTTLAQAQKIAQDLLDVLGLKDIQISSVQTGAIFGKWNKQGYAVTCTQTIEGIPLTYSEGGIHKQQKVDDQTGEILDYVQTWRENRITIEINDTGIVGFTWLNPVEVNRVANENVALLPFDEIKQNFLQQMKSHFIVDNKSTGKIYKVINIKLGMVIIPEKDKPGSFLAVPAWTFFGYSVDPNRKDQTKLTTSEFMNGSIEKCLMIINAIDGSLIEK